MTETTELWTTASEATHNMKLKLTRQPVTRDASASLVPERPGSLTKCYAS